jgi:UTP--glucose-1-phosphate uridylyltransferase
MKVRKIIIPAAGFGTRFLPQVKAMPKEMLPIVDKPVIQYIVEEAVAAGIEDVIIVTNSNKRAIEDHFDTPNQDLIKNLVDGNKTQMIDELYRIADMANFIYIRQKGPYGNATPVKISRHLVNEEPFFVVFGDDIMLASPESRMQQMVKAYEKYGATILGGVIADKPGDYSKYGYIEGEDLGGGVWKVNKLIEKPGVDNAPSKIAINGGYLLTPEIFDILETQKPGKGGEFYLAEAINELIAQQPVYAIVLENGKYCDTGSKLSYLKTVVEFAAKHPDIGEEFSEFLREFKG